MATNSVNTSHIESAAPSNNHDVAHSSSASLMPSSSLTPPNPGIDDSELSFNSEVDPPVVSRPNQYSDATAPPAIATEEVRTSDDDDGGILRAELVWRLRKKSCSHRNFVAKLVQVLFDKDTRKKSNMAGKWEEEEIKPHTDTVYQIAFLPAFSFRRT